MPGDYNYQVLIQVSIIIIILWMKLIDNSTHYTNNIISSNNKNLNLGQSDENNYEWKTN